MAHFAELGESNVVKRTIVVANAVITNEAGDEDESLGVAFLKQTYGNQTTWKQTSYSNSFRKNFATEGFVYDADKDAFISPKPYPSWTLNETTCKYDPPVEKPANGNGEADGHINYSAWDEDNQQWVVTEVLWNEPE